jgi:flagellar biosynthesis protein FlhA
MLAALRRFVTKGKEFTLICGVVLILIVLFSPIPPIALDLAILINIGLSLTILLLTLQVRKPVEFSTFPSLLLISTLLRLALNIAATRLILTSGYAGEVIDAIGGFAVGGNFVVGLVVFFILVVVQYVVVTSGAQRVSEVAARFTLDSMPGQQMSIDADLNMGLIDQKEAVRRRRALEKEASFYGAMDGASKFVKGDAIAGVIILLINIIAGWIIGVVQMEMGWSEALRHFTLLTIGDGIATQFPALIISTATGIIVTRSSADRDLSTEVFQQLSSAPHIPLIVAGMLTVLLLLPGMPKWPILLLLVASYFAWKHLRKRAESAAADEDAPDAMVGEGANAPLGSLPLCVALGETLSASWRSNEALLLERIAGLRDSHESAFGVTLPPVKLIDSAQLGANEYEIRLFGARYANAEVRLGDVLAIRSEPSRRTIEGVETVDPAFGLPAVWIEEARAPAAREAGYTIVDPVTVFITHLGEVLRAEAPGLLTRAAVAKLLEDARARQPGLVEEMTPTLLSVSDVQHVLQSLVSEGVSIASLDFILEHLADLARTEKDAGNLAELLRQRMGYAICNRLRGRYRDLAVMSLDPKLENQIQAAVATSMKKDTLMLEPRLAERLLRKLGAMTNDMMREGREPVLLCGGEIRRQLRALTRRSAPRLSILSVNEIPTSIDLRSHGIVRADEEAPREAPKPAPPALAQLELGTQDGRRLQ